MDCKRILILLASFFICSCEGGQVGTTEKGAIAGGALGAGLGAIVGHQSGHSGEGAAIGAAIGALSGAIAGHGIEKQEKQIEEQEKRLAEQERLIQENRKLLEELRSRGADARTTERGVVVNLGDVYFEFDSDRLTAEARDTIRKIAEVLRDAPERHVSVEGHTDSIGTFAYNQDLSERRARSVASELVYDGISRQRISTRGFGETRPIASNKTAAGRRMNRRVEVIVENPHRHNY
ncbi:MAG: OmpA family protein [Candidatus Dadabacteria bacterium]|nr:MAG: OmpA family protein [Candidatus Dadabacteria bacterium]